MRRDNGKAAAGLESDCRCGEYKKTLSLTTRKLDGNVYSLPVARLIFANKEKKNKKNFGDFISLLTCPSGQLVCHNHLTLYGTRSERTSSIKQFFLVVRHTNDLNAKCVWPELKTKHLLRSSVWMNKFAVWGYRYVMRDTYQNIRITTRLFPLEWMLARARAQAFWPIVDRWPVSFTSNCLSEERLHSFLVSRVCGTGWTTTFANNNDNNT